MMTEPKSAVSYATTQDYEAKQSKEQIQIVESTRRGSYYATIGKTVFPQLYPLSFFRWMFSFICKFPRRIRNFFIEAFYVPKFRKEWGVYQAWIPQVPLRPKPVKIETLEDLREREGERKSEQRQLWLKLRQFQETKLATLQEELPKPVQHDHSQCEILRINVAGMMFETQMRTVNQFPDTLLGHPGRRIQFYDPASNEYFFDRNRTCFEAIMYYYQTGGVLRRPFNTSADMFLEEIKFFDLGDEAVRRFTQDEGFIQEDLKELPHNMLQRKIWLLFEYPESSYQAKIVAILSVMVVLDSILIFCIETMDMFSTSASGSKRKFKDEEITTLSDPFFIVETSCVFWFGFEFVIRIITCPKKIEFLKGVTNLIDMIAIAPYFIGLGMGRDNDESSAEETTKGTLTLLRIIRLVRVFRILKLSRHNRGLKILGMTLKASFRELGLLIVFMLIAIIVFSSAVYFAENRISGGHPGFSSVPESFWWAVCTMTTLGYGDIVPRTVPGKLVGSLCCIAGVLTLALPVPIIVSNFNMFYHREDKEELDTSKSSYEHVMHCPLYSAKYGTDGAVIDPPIIVRRDEDEEEERWQVSGTERDWSDTEFYHLRYEERLKDKGKVQSKGSDWWRGNKTFEQRKVEKTAEQIIAKEPPKVPVKTKAKEAEEEKEPPPVEKKPSYHFFWGSSSKPPPEPIKKPSFSRPSQTSQSSRSSKKKTSNDKK